MNKKNNIIAPRLIDRIYTSYIYGVKVKVNPHKKKLLVCDLSDSINKNNYTELNSVHEELYFELCDFFGIDIKKYGVSSTNFKGDFVIDAHGTKDEANKCSGEANYHIKLVILVESILDGAYNPKYISTLFSKKKFYKYIEEKSKQDIFVLMEEFEIKKLYNEMLEIYKEICHIRYFFLTPFIPIRKKFFLGEQTEAEHSLYTRIRVCSIKIHFLVCE